MTKLNKTDLRLLARYVDGEMAGDECSNFEQRLGQDSALRVAEAAARQQSQGIRDADPLVVAAPDGFAASVLDSVRCMPSREDLIQQCAEEEAVVAVVGYARRLLIAAVLVCGFSVLFGLKILVSADTGKIVASEQELKELDAKVRAMKMAELERLRKNR